MCIRDSNRQLCEEPSYDEIVQVIIHLNNSEAPDEDSLVTKFLKNGGPALWKRLYLLMKEIWSECANYRGITLLDITCKIFSLNL